MKNIYYFLTWFFTLIFTSAVDALWHLVFFGKQYAQDFKPIGRAVNGKFAFDPIFGLLAQVAMTAAIVFLVLYKKSASLFEAGVIGATAGILAISVYGLSSHALLKNWTMRLTILEVVWGPILGALAGVFTYWTITNLNPKGFT
jgi:uncharacterized membrane protein